MDSFESTLATFDNTTDQHNFMEFFQQQNNGNGGNVFANAAVSQAGGTGAAPSSGMVNSGSANGNNSTLGGGNTTNMSDLSSPTATLLRSSASPTNLESINGDTTVATTAPTDSPSPSFAHTNNVPSSTSATPASARAAKIFAASHQIHPVAATPIRHQSLPFDQSQQIAQQQQMQQHNSQQHPRYIAGPSSRQLSMGSPSSNPGSPSLMRPPPPIQTGNLMNGTPNAAGDYLNPNSSISASPSPLRSASSLSNSTSNDGNLRHSPTGTLTHKQEDGSGSPMVPAHSPHTAFNPYGAMFGSNQDQQQGSNSKDSGSNAADGSSNAASAKFVHKLFRMVSDAEYQHLISWNASGTSVVVTNFDEFAKEVLGKHFKHSNFSSFIRQLNMYGFYKVNKTPRGHRHAVDTQIWEFSHPKFIRGHPELLDDIRRKALDSEHARVEARDLQYSVSVGHMQLRQQVDDQQYRIEELMEMNMALRQVVGGLRDTLGNVVEWVKANNGGQLPFENRMAVVEMPPTPMFHPYMQDASVWGVPGQGMPGNDVVSDGPPIFVTEPAFHSQPQASQHDVFSMAAMGQVSPMASRRVSTESQSAERMEGAHPNVGKLALDTQMQFGNPGLGVMGLNQAGMNSQMVAAVNTPLPPSPAVHGGPQMGYSENSPFLGSPSMASFPGQPAGYFTGSNMMSPDDEESLLGPNSKAMRTPLKRTASNSGSHQMAVQVAMQNHAQQQQQQKRKSPGV